MKRDHLGFSQTLSLRKIEASFDDRVYRNYITNHDHDMFCKGNRGFRLKKQFDASTILWLEDKSKPPKNVLEYFIKALLMNL